MSWCKAIARGGDRQVRRGRAGVVASALMVLAASLSGCADGSGFRPMYAATANSPALQEKLASVEITPIPSRVGQRIRNELIFHATGGGAPAAPAYRLDVVMRESVTAMLIKVTGEAGSSTYNLDAQFNLIDLKTKKVILTGTSYGRASFDRFPSIYSNVRAREEAENSAAGVVAEDMKTRIAAFLSNGKV
jgi:LPS-assembly lipoprotein